MKSILVIFALIFSFGCELPFKLIVLQFNFLDASIDFTSSTMYDINDFLHKDEVVSLFFFTYKHIFPYCAG